MTDIGVKLHPIKKIQIWQAIKKEVFTKMDNDVISPRRADEILGDIKQRIVGISSPEQAKEFYLLLPKMYVELTPVTNKFGNQEAEKLEKILTLLLDEIIGKGDLDLAGELVEKIKQSGNNKNLIEELQSEFPSEFQICLKRFSQEFN